MLIELYKDQAIFQVYKEALDFTEDQRVAYMVRAFEGLGYFFNEGGDGHGWHNIRREHFYDVVRGDIFKKMVWASRFNHQIPTGWFHLEEIQEDISRPFVLQDKLITASVEHPSVEVVRAVGEHQLLTPKQLARIISRSEELGIDDFDIFAHQSSKGLTSRQIDKAKYIAQQKAPLLHGLHPSVRAFLKGLNLE